MGSTMAENFFVDTCFPGNPPEMQPCRGLGGLMWVLEGKHGDFAVWVRWYHLELDPDWLSGAGTQPQWSHRVPTLASVAHRNLTWEGVGWREGMLKI